MSFSKQVFINLPVTDLAVSTGFYEKLGFTKNLEFSNDVASAMVWSENIFIMLLTYEFYQKFTKKTIADTTKTTSALISLTLETREAVQKFADIAVENGGSCFIADPNKDLDFMFCYEVTDPDGHTLEPVFMDMGKVGS